MGKKRSIIRFLSIRAMFIFFIFSIVFAIVSGYDSYLKFQDSTKSIKSNYLKNTKEKIKWEVKHYIGLINNAKDSAVNEYKSRAKSRVYEAHTLASGFYNRYKDVKSEEEIKKLIIETLRNIRFENQNGYYFIFDLNGIARLFADKPELEGKNILSIHNRDNVYVVKEMIELAQNSSEGFYSYMWTKPNQKSKEFEKISYIKLFKEYGWVMGAGTYVNDIDESAKKKIINNLESIKFDPVSNNYIFIGNWDGVSQTYPVKGKNMLQIRDKNGLYIVKELIKKAKSGGGYVEYVMPSFEGLKNTTKLSYTEPIKEWEWYVGAGVYIDDINSDISKLKKDMYDDMKNSAFTVLIILFVLFLIFIMINRKFYKKLEKDFSTIVSFLDSVVKDDKKIDRKTVVFEEFDTIAKSGNKMLQKKLELDYKLEHLAYHDILTKLPNRVLLQDRIKQAKQNAKRYNKLFAICFIDLDNFKKINDNFGHDYGDDILFQFAQNIQKNIRKVDTVARVGGDEFILLLEHLDATDKVEMIIKKIQEKLKKPLLSKSKEFNISASIGISIYPNDGDSIKDLITKADDTMYRAKKEGKNRYLFYSDTFPST